MDLSRELWRKMTIRWIADAGVRAQFTGCLIEVRPVGVLNMVDLRAGSKNSGGAQKHPRYDEIPTMDQIWAHMRREIEHFFTIYKELEGKQTRIDGWRGPSMPAS